MKKLRIGMIIIAIIWIIANLTFINYSNLSWSENHAAYGTFIAMCILIAGLIYSIRYDKKHK